MCLPLVQWASMVAFKSYIRKPPTQWTRKATLIWLCVIEKKQKNPLTYLLLTELASSSSGFLQAILKSLYKVFGPVMEHPLQHAQWKSTIRCGHRGWRILDDLDSQHIRTNISFMRNLVVDERMRSGHWLASVSWVSVSVATWLIGWGEVNPTWENCLPIIPKVLFTNKCRKKTEGTS